MHWSSLSIRRSGWRAEHTLRLPKAAIPLYHVSTVCGFRLKALTVSHGACLVHFSDTFRVVCGLGPLGEDEREERHQQAQAD